MGSRGQDVAKIAELSERVGFLNDSKSTAVAAIEARVKTVAKNGAAMFVQEGATYAVLAAENIDASTIPDAAADIVPRLLAQRHHISYQNPGAVAFSVFPLITGPRLLGFLVLVSARKRSKLGRDTNAAMNCLCISLCAALEAVKLDTIQGGRTIA